MLLTNLTLSLSVCLCSCRSTHLLVLVQQIWIFFLSHNWVLTFAQCQLSNRIYRNKCFSSIQAYRLVIFFSSVMGSNALSCSQSTPFWNSTFRCRNLKSNTFFCLMISLSMSVLIIAYTLLRLIFSLSLSVFFFVSVVVRSSLQAKRWKIKWMGFINAPTFKCDKATRKTDKNNLERRRGKKSSHTSLIEWIGTTKNAELAKWLYSFFLSLILFNV